MADEAAITAAAVLTLARAGDFGAIHELFAPQVRAMVSAEGLEAAWTAESDRAGAVTRVGAPSSEPLQTGLTVVKVPVTFERGER